jgi:hypothetical protein
VIRRLIAGVVLAGSVLTLFTGAPATGAQPAVKGGVPAPGNPAVVGLAIRYGKTWVVCSATVLRPRVLLTAAHCLTRPESSVAADRVRVFPPGARVRVYSNTGPKRPSPIAVLRWWIPGGYVNSGGRVQANDVAVVLLAADIGPSGFTRLATQSELAAWAAQKAPVVHLGYGGTGAPGTGAYSPIPHYVTLPFAAVSMNSSVGATFSTTASQNAALCAGDSGGPAFVAAPGAYYLVGTAAGASGPCTSDPTDPPNDLGFAAIGYAGLINNAFAEAGYPTIPTAPERVRITARNRDVTVAWAPPAVSPQTVSAYDVLDTDGAVVCQTDQLSCVRPGLADGSYRYSVRARNAQNEGDALPAAAPAVVAAPPAPAAPTIERVTTRRVRITVTTLTGRTSAVVTSYVVRDQKGGVVCAIAPPTPETPVLSCAGPTARGVYSVSVHAETEMGPSPESPLSVAFSIR